MNPSFNFPAYGPGSPRSVKIADGLVRVLAPNPSPMTYYGTNTYLLGKREVAVIDPGPRSELHMNTILQALDDDAEISTILVTHAHRDHSSLASDLSARTGALICAFGDSKAGRHVQMSDLSHSDMPAGVKGVDDSFVPDRKLCPGEVLEGQGWSIEAIWTPGHFGNHMCFAWREGGVIFTGDHVMGWSTSVVSPPDGSMTDYLESLGKLLTRPETIYLPGHGDRVENAQGLVNSIIEHRMAREREILQLLGLAPSSSVRLAREIYSGLSSGLLWAATMNIFAHLLDLRSRRIVDASGPVHPESVFGLRQDHRIQRAS